MTASDPKTGLAHEPRVERDDHLVDLQPGEYWRAGRKTADSDGDPIPKGTVLLLKAVKSVDGRPHTVVLHPHPDAGSFRTESGHHFLVDDFLAAFEPAPDGKQVREREMAAIRAKVDDLQRRAATEPDDRQALLPLARKHGYRDDKALPPGTVPRVDDDTTVVSLAAASETLRPDAVQRHMENEIAVSKARGERLSALAKDLAETAKRLTPYYEEMGVVALARTQDLMRAAESVIKGVQTLGLYTGKDVEVVLLRDGEPAPPRTPVTLMQRKLFMDEESIINAAEGGIDWHGRDLFAKELRENPALLERLIPAPRGVVAMASSRTDRDYGHPWANAAENARNRAAFLIVRDGGRVHQVRSELGTHDAKRLFPAHDDLDRPFRGFDGRRITLQDVRFADAQEEHDDIALFYKRLLILLCGLHDRLRLLGELDVPPAPLALFGLDAQRRVFQFAHDDEGNALSEGHPPFDEWMKTKNKGLRSGSRVACVWNRLMDPKSCPSATAYDQRDHKYFRYKPAEEHGIRVVHRDGDDLCVATRVAGDTQWGAKSPTREFEARIAVNRTEDELSYLVLDDVDPAEITHYVLSRQDRQHYLSYIPTLVSARKHLLEDDERERPARDLIRKDLVEGNVVPADHDPDDAVRAAIRKWRAANRGKPFPLPRQPGFREAETAVLNQIYVVLGHGRDRAREAEKIAAAERRTPLRLAITGRKRLVLYASPLPREKETRVGGHPWVQRIVLEERKTRISPVDRKWTTLPESRADETILREWPEAAEWIGRKAPCDLSYDQARTLLRAVETGHDVIASFAGPIDRERFSFLLSRSKALTERLSGRYVSTPYVSFPVMLLERPGTKARKSRFGGTEPPEPPTYCVVTLTAKLHRLIHLNAPDDGRKDTENWISATYRTPKNALKELAERDPFRVTVTEALHRIPADPLDRNGAALGDTIGVEGDPYDPKDLLAAVNSRYHGPRDLRPVVSADLAAIKTLIAGKPPKSGPKAP